MVTQKLKTKIILKDSLRELPIKGSLVIKNRQFKAAVVRTTANILKREEGYVFDVTDRGRIDDILVTRIK